MEGGPLGLAQANGEAPRYGGKFLHAGFETIPFYDMHQTSRLGVYAVTAPAYNGLVSTNPYDPLAQEVIPDLARTWEFAEGGTKVIFHLAEGVRWHDGVPFSSADVKYTIDRIMNPPEGMVSPRGPVFKAIIESVDAPDPNTVVVNGKGASGLLVPLFASGHNAIIPKHISEVDPVNALKTTVIGTGAFKLKKDPSTLLWEYERNQDYFEPELPYLDEFDYHIITDIQTMAASILTQRVYWPDAVGSAILDEDLALSMAADEPGLVYTTITGLTLAHVVMNSTKPPFDDLRVRQAISEGIRREDIGELGPTTGAVGTGNFPMGPWALPREVQEQLIGYGPDMDKRITHAKELLADYEAEKGEIDWSKIQLQTSSNLKVILENAQVIQQLLKKIDVNVEIDAMDVVQHRGNEVSGDFLVSTLGAGLDFDDPIDTFGQLFVTGGGRWYQKRSIPELDALYQQQAFESDFEKRRDLVWEMDKIAMNDASYLVLHWFDSHHIMWDFVKGIVITPNLRSANARMKYVWLDFPDLPTSR
jgi:peptide/nickel transport system substrate-binding protein